jgi:hypothetical protein
MGIESPICYDTAVIGKGKHVDIIRLLAWHQGCNKGKSKKQTTNEEK